MTLAISISTVGYRRTGHAHYRRAFAYSFGRLHCHRASDCGSACHCEMTSWPRPLLIPRAPGTCCDRSRARPAARSQPTRPRGGYVWVPRRDYLGPPGEHVDPYAASGIRAGGAPAPSGPPVRAAPSRFGPVGNPSRGPMLAETITPRPPSRGRTGRRRGTFHRHDGTPPAGRPGTRRRRAPPPHAAGTRVSTRLQRGAAPSFSNLAPAVISTIFVISIDYSQQNIAIFINPRFRTPSSWGAGAVHQGPKRCASTAPSVGAAGSGQRGSTHLASRGTPAPLAKQHRGKRCCSILATPRAAGFEADRS